MRVYLFIYDHENYFKFYFLQHGIVASYLIYRIELCKLVSIHFNLKYKFFSMINMININMHFLFLIFLII